MYGLSFFCSNHKWDEKHCRYVDTAAVLVSKCFANCIGPFAVNAVASDSAFRQT